MKTRHERKQGFFVGYAKNVMGDRVYYEHKNKVVIDREIIFKVVQLVEGNFEHKFISLYQEKTEGPSEDLFINNTLNLFIKHI